MVFARAAQGLLMFHQGGGLLRAILADSRVLSSLSRPCLSPHPFLSPQGPLLTGQGSFHQKLQVISFPQQPPSSHCPGPTETHWLEGLTLALAACPLWRAFRTFESLPAHADLERCLWERRGCASLLFQGQKSEDVLPSCYVGDVIFIPQSKTFRSSTCIPPLIPCSMCTGATHTAASRTAAQGLTRPPAKAKALQLQPFVA